MQIFTGTASDAANYMADRIMDALRECPGHGPIRETYYCDGRCQQPIRPQSVRRALPDPAVTGPCQAKVHWTCTGQAQGERLNPLAMLPGSTVSTEYVPMCQPCYDHLADQFVAARHA